MNDNNLRKLIAPYKGTRLWLVLDSDRKKIVSKKKNLIEALKEAKKKGVKNPSVIKAVPDIPVFIGVC